MLLSKDFQKIKVEQLANKNQFVITFSQNGKVALAFQSYKSLVAVYDKESDILYISWQYWDYSKTTLKHFKLFINNYTPFSYENKSQFISFIKNEQGNKVILI